MSFKSKIRKIIESNRKIVRVMIANSEIILLLL